MRWANRYEDLVGVGTLRQRPVTVVGVGAVGRQIVKLLSYMGVSQIALVDPDDVGEENLGCQGWENWDVGRKKVRVCKEEVEGAVEYRAGDTEWRVVAYEDEWDAGVEPTPVVFCCVDDMGARNSLYHNMFGEYGACQFFVDTRMRGDALRVLTVYREREESLINYERSLFTDEEREPGRCTAQTTLYGSYVVAGVAVSKYVQWLRGFKPEPDMIIDLLASVMVRPKLEETDDVVQRSARSGTDTGEAGTGAALSGTGEAEAGPEG